MLICRDIDVMLWLETATAKTPCSKDHGICGKDKIGTF